MELVCIIRMIKHFRHSQESEPSQWSLWTDTVVCNFSGLPWTLKKLLHPSAPQLPMASHQITDSLFSREGDEACPKVQMTECAMDVTKGGEPVSSFLGARPSTQAISADASDAETSHPAPVSHKSVFPWLPGPIPHTAANLFPFLPLIGCLDLPLILNFFTLFISWTPLWTATPPHSRLPMRPYWPFASYMPLKLLWPSHQNLDQMMSPVPFLA